MKVGIEETAISESDASLHALSSHMEGLHNRLLERFFSLRSQSFNLLVLQLSMYALIVALISMMNGRGTLLDWFIWVGLGYAVASCWTLRELLTLLDATVTKDFEWDANEYQALQNLKPSDLDGHRVYFLNVILLHNMTVYRDRIDRYFGAFRFFKFSSMVWAVIVAIGLVVTTLGII